MMTYIIQLKKLQLYSYMQMLRKTNDYTPQTRTLLKLNGFTSRHTHICSMVSEVVLVVVAAAAHLHDVRRAMALRRRRALERVLLVLIVLMLML